MENQDGGQFRQRQTLGGPVARPTGSAVPSIARRPKMLTVGQSAERAQQAGTGPSRKGRQGRVVAQICPARLTFETVLVDGLSVVGILETWVPSIEAAWARRRKSITVHRHGLFGGRQNQLRLLAAMSG